MLFGQLLRRRRQAEDLLLGDLARTLKISVPYLSQIETGQRFVPEGFEDKVIAALKVNPTDANEMRRAAAVSRSEYRLQVKKEDTIKDRTLARDLAESFARLSPEAREELGDVLRRHRYGR